MLHASNIQLIKHTSIFLLKTHIDWLCARICRILKQNNILKQLLLGQYVFLWLNSIGLNGKYYRIRSALYKYFYPALEIILKTTNLRKNRFALKTGFLVGVRLVSSLDLQNKANGIKLLYFWLVRFANNSAVCIWYAKHKTSKMNTVLLRFVRVKESKFLFQCRLFLYFWHSSALLCISWQADYRVRQSQSLSCSHFLLATFLIQLTGAVFFGDKD